jgi:glycosyltransferase involved in cell wall biosynthesis
MRPTFSIIVPTCRRPELLPRALASVLALDVDDYECIVVDDGGADAPVVPDDPRFHLVRHPETRGLPFALNTGLEAACGDYVTFLDDDDEFTPDRLSMVMPELDGRTGVLCWASTDGPPHPHQRALQGRVFEVILDDAAPAKGAVVLPRDAVPRFDTRYLALEDLEWWLRVASIYEVTTVTRVGYLIHHHRGTRDTNGPRARVRCGQLLLDEHADYFRTHRRAAARRWRMVGGAALQLGDRSLARAALLRSFVLKPSRQVLKRLLRALPPAKPNGSPAARVESDNVA